MVYQYKPLLTISRCCEQLVSRHVTTAITLSFPFPPALNLPKALAFAEQHLLRVWPLWAVPQSAASEQFNWWMIVDDVA